MRLASRRGATVNMAGARLFGGQRGAV